MASSTKEVAKRIAGLSNLMADARRALAQLGENDNADIKLRRANLQTTITTVQRELVLARQWLQGARDLGAAAEPLAGLEGRLEARSGQIQARAQLALDRTIASDAIKEILTSATTSEKNRRRRGKKRHSIP